MSTQTKHTPVPWRVAGDNSIQLIRSVAEDGKELPRSRGRDIARVWSRHIAKLDEEGKANSARIVACVNALEGIPNSALEAGAVRELVEAAKVAKSWIMKRSHKPGADKISERLYAALAKLEGRV